MSPQCEAVTNPDSLWPDFCPNIGAAYAFAVLFALITVAHFVQMIVHRKLYSLVIAISALLQTATYVLRVLSIKNVTSSWMYSSWFILMMVCLQPILTALRLITADHGTVRLLRSGPMHTPTW